MLFVGEDLRGEEMARGGLRVKRASSGFVVGLDGVVFVSPW